jgi:carbon-monoxide dehydrogenase medium subunit
MITAHPGLPEMDYIRPASLVEASRFLAEHAGEAVPFMGGTDIFVRMRDGVRKGKYLVDVKGLDGTNEIHYDPASGLTLGAAVNMNRVIQSGPVQQCYPLLAEAARTVASYQLRTRATVVGNLCNASPAGDTTGACLVMGGVLKVHGVDGTRQEPLNTFFLGPGKTVLHPGDVVTAIWFPILPEGCAGRYLKLGRNRVGDLAIVGVTVLGARDPGAASGYRFRIALASVAPVPLAPVEAEAILADKPVTEETIAEAAQAAMQASRPIDDVRGSAHYRRLMVRNLTRKAVSEVWRKLWPTTA